MGMTQTQKILAAHAGLAEVKAGQLINAKLDIVLGNDITTPVATKSTSPSSSTTSFPTRTSRARPSPSSAASSPTSTTSSTSTMWARWASSTLCCPKKAS